jgi:hypothetical protein
MSIERITERMGRTGRGSKRTLPERAAGRLWAGLLAAGALSLVVAVSAWGAEIVTVTLVGGGRVTAPLLRQSDEGVVLDLGHDVLQIPAKRVLDVRREDEAAVVMDAVQRAQQLLRDAGIKCDTDTTTKPTPGQKFRSWCGRCRATRPPFFLLHPRSFFFILVLLLRRNPSSVVSIS